jgi:hypothetical protein
MANAQNICDRAYQKIGLASPTTAEDTLAFNALNDMISAWGAKFLVPYHTRESFALVVGQAEYTVGSGGNFDTVRPMLIKSAYLVDSDDYSYPLTVVSAIDYNRIGRKTQEGRPTKLYYINEYSLVKLIFNKETDEVYTVYLDFLKNFTAFATIGATIALPSEYIEALIYNLAIKLAEDNSIELPASVSRTAANSLILISRLLAANQLPPKVLFDFGSGSRYDITYDE